MHRAALISTTIRYIAREARAISRPSKYTGTRSSICVRSPFSPMMQTVPTMMGSMVNTTNSRPTCLMDIRLARRPSLCYSAIAAVPIRMVFCDCPGLGGERSGRFRDLAIGKPPPGTAWDASEFRSGGRRGSLAFFGRCKTCEFCMMSHMEW
jgi:hypothetical protein